MCVAHGQNQVQREGQGKKNVTKPTPEPRLLCPRQPVAVKIVVVLMRGAAYRPCSHPGAVVYAVWPGTRSLRGHISAALSLSEDCSGPLTERACRPSQSH